MGSKQGKCQNGRPKTRLRLPLELRIERPPIVGLVARDGRRPSQPTGTGVERPSLGHLPGGHPPPALATFPSRPQTAAPHETLTKLGAAVDRLLPTTALASTWAFSKHKAPT